MHVLTLFAAKQNLVDDLVIFIGLIEKVFHRVRSLHSGDGMGPSLMGFIKNIDVIKPFISFWITHAIGKGFLANKTVELKAAIHELTQFLNSVVVTANRYETKRQEAATIVMMRGKLLPLFSCGSFIRIDVALNAANTPVEVLNVSLFATAQADA